MSSPRFTRPGLLRELAGLLVEWLWDSPRPSPVPYQPPELPADVPPGLVRTRIVCDECLTPDEYRACGGNRRGTAWWWLREESGPFVPVPLPAGTEPLDVTLDLEPGCYVLGTGRRPHRTIRRRIVVQ